ncbi:MAG: autotransporter-associated beta strand repeat-containing protein, partial [Gammaproteobacteria bacterium]
LSGTNAYTGATSINAGTLRLGAVAVIADSSAVSLLNVASAIFDLNGNNETIGSLAGGGATGGNVSLGAGTLTTGDSSNTTYAGVISGSGGLTKQGSGIFTLSGTNAYTGATSINAGTLRLGAAAVIADSSAVSLLNVASAIFDLNGNNETIGSLAGGGATGGNVSLGAGTLTTGDTSNTTYAGVISGSGGLTKQGSGIFTLSGTNAYTGATSINAGTLRLGAAAVIADSSAVSLLNVASAIFDLNGNNETIGSLAGGGATGGNVSLGAGTLTTGDSSNTTYAGAISGSGGLTKQGSGIFTLSGTNAYTGATSINAGTLRLGAAGVINDANAVTLANVAGAIFDLNGNNETIGSIAGGGATGGNVSLGAGTLTTGNGSNTTYAGVISGSGGLTKQGSGIFTLSGTNAYTGATSINAGTLRLGAAAVIADSSAVSLLNVASAIFDLNGNNETIGSLAGGGATGGNVSLGAGTLTTGDTSNTTYAGVISGSGGLTKQGSGIFTLSGTNLYTGDTTINAGILRLGAASVIADTSAMTFANVAGAIFDLNGFDETIGTLSGGGATGGDISLGAGTLTAGNASDTTYNGTISGAGGLNKVGTGTLILNTDNNYTGTTAILNGTLEMGAADGIPAGSGLFIASTGTLGLGGFDKTFAGLSGNGNINLGTATLTINNAVNTVYDGVLSGSGNLIKQGTGMLTLNSVNSYTGTTLLDINGGTLQLGVANALSNSSVVTLSSGSTLDLNGFNTVVNELSGSGDVTLGSAMLTANNASSSVFSGNVTGSGGLIKSGAGVLTLSGNNGFTGKTSIDAGVLNLVNNTGLSTSSGTTVASGAALNISNTTVTLNPIALAGVLTSTGTSVLNGDINLTASSVIDSSGSLALNGTISGATGLTLQGTGTITLANSLVGLGSLSSTANQLTLNGGAVSTSGNQYYSNTLVLGTDTTMTVGNNSSISLPAVVTGNLTLAGGSNSTFSAPSKSSGVNTINITGGGAGFINDPIYFGGFQTINGLGNTSVVFNALAKNLTYNSGTGVVSAVVGNMTFFFINIPLSAFSGNIQVDVPFVPVPIPDVNSIIATNSAIVQLMAQMTSSTGGLSVVQDQSNQTDNTSAMSDSYNAFSNFAVTQNITLMLDEVNSSVQKDKEKQTFGICPI